MVDRTGERTDDESIELIQRALNERTDLPDRADALYAHSVFLKIRATRTGSMNDLNAAVTEAEKATALTKEGDPHRARRFDHLSLSLQVRSRETRSVQDATAAINHAITALGAIPRAPGINSVRLCWTYARAMQLRSKITGSKQDLDIIIPTLESTINFLPKEDWEGRALLMDSLGNSLALRVERTETNYDDDLECLMLVRKATVQLTPPNDPDWPGRLHNLALSYMVRFMKKKTSEDLDTAIEKLQEAIKLMPQDRHKALCLENLATCLDRRLQLTGSRTDRNVILQALDESLDLAPGWGRNRNSILFNYALQLLESYEMTESIEDLNKGIEELQNLASSTAEQDPLQSQIYNNLGVALIRRAQRLRSLNDLDAAIQVIQSTIRIRIADPTGQGMSLGNLGTVFMTRYDWSGAGFTEARNAYEEALRLIPEDYNYRYNVLCNFGNLYHMRFDKAGSVDDLRKAIEFKREAVEKSSTGMYRVLVLKGLGDALKDLYEKTGSKNDLNAAVEAYEEGFTCIQSPPSKRIISAAKGANLAGSTNSRKASYLFTKAVELLPTASPRTLNRDDQQYTLSQFSGIAANAATLAVQVGEGVSEALRLLELGRGVIFSTALETRSDITDLDTAHPDLATQFRTLRDKFDVPQHTPSDDVSAHTSVLGLASRYSVSEEFDGVIKSIRSHKGFENFLLGPSITELKALASEGPIVYLNASRFGNGSFLIKTTGVEYLPLPDLKTEDIEKNATLLATTLKYDDAVTRRKSIETTRRILKWLWGGAVEPILKQLGFTQTPQNEENWPHIWWVPVGQLVVFPFHAASHFPHDGRSTLDRVISSYTPTIRALGYARGKVNQTKNAHPNRTVLLAVMPETPDLNPLPFSKAEVNAIDALLPRSIPREILLKPTKSEVLEKIEQCSVAHFSCHGRINPNPSKSQIYLEDWKANPLTVADMARLKLGQVQLAYLSACHAGNNPDLRLLDEAVHMAGACQLAGFPSVIGTLWHVSDFQTAILTQQFYKSLLDKENKLDFGRTASALHFALRKIRDDSSQRFDDPVEWAPYIHVGV